MVSMSSRCRGKDDYNEERSKSGLVLISLLTLRHKQHHPDGVPPSCGCIQGLLSISFQSESHPVPRGPTDPAGSIIKRQTGDNIINNKTVNPTLPRNICCTAHQPSKSTAKRPHRHLPSAPRWGPGAFSYFKASVKVYSRKV